MTGIRHTFFFHESIWKSLGYYTGNSGKIYTLQGESAIRKYKDGFMAEMHYSVISGVPMEIAYRFRIVPGIMHDNCMWNSAAIFSPSIDGRIMYMNEFIFLLYQSAEHRFSGVENLEMIDGTHYKNHGYAFMDEQKIAAWILDWRRMK